MPKQILLVDDDALLCRSLSYSLKQAGYEVQTAGTAEDGLAQARRDLPDLLLLDIGLPGMDGFTALREFRALGDMPVIFLTGRRGHLDEALGLELGADDYISKPFDPAVLLARIKAALRHYARSAVAAPESTTVVVGDLIIDRETNRVTVAGRPVKLPPRVFDLLFVLAQQPDQVVSSDDLVTRVWGAEYRGERATLYTHMRWLRENLEEDPDHPRRVVALWRRGYKLVPHEP
jgi:two-component system response regulator VicR